MRKCLQCGLHPLEDGIKWCSMECKKKFLLENYDMNCSIRAFKEDTSCTLSEQEKKDD